MTRADLIDKYQQRLENLRRRYQRVPRRERELFEMILKDLHAMEDPTELTYPLDFGGGGWHDTGPTNED